MAAVVAASALLDRPLAQRALYQHALEGERVASGADCGDNVGPQLLGGLVLAAGDDLIRIAVPEGLTAVVVRPDMSIETRQTRAALEAPFDLGLITAAQANLARVLAGCYANDFGLIRKGLRDVLIEPRRAGLIPGFEAVKQTALDHQALGASLSGSGPSIFAWFTSAPEVHRAAPVMVEAFEQANPGRHRPHFPGRRPGGAAGVSPACSRPGTTTPVIPEFASANIRDLEPIRWHSAGPCQT